MLPTGKPQHISQALRYKSLKKKKRKYLHICYEIGLAEKAHSLMFPIERENWHPEVEFQLIFFY